MRIATGVIAIMALALGVAAHAQPTVAPARSTYPIPSAAGSGPGFKPCSASVIQSDAANDFQQCVAGSAQLAALVEARLAELSNQPGEAGCLGKDEVTCLASLSQVAVIASHSSEPLPPPSRDEIDINGRTITHEVSVQIAYAPSEGVAFPTGFGGMFLTIGRGDVVTEIYVGLPSDPLVARTQADWDQTGVYDFTRAVLGAACVPEDRLTFYRHVDARIHGHAIASTTIDNGPSPSVSRQRTATEARCGQTTDVSSGWSDDATFGTAGGGSISFRLPGQS